MVIGVVWQREWEGRLMLGEIRAKERQILADLASLCHGKEAKGQQDSEHVGCKAQSARVLGRDGPAGGGRASIHYGGKQGQGCLFPVRINRINTSAMGNPWTVGPPSCWKPSIVSKTVEQSNTPVTDREGNQQSPSSRREICLYLKLQ